MPSPVPSAYLAVDSRRKVFPQEEARMNIPPQTLMIGAVMGALVGYSISRNAHKQYGRAPFGWPDWAWMLFGFAFGIIPTGLVFWLGGRKIWKQGKLTAASASSAGNTPPHVANELPEASPSSAPGD
jgi:hypothetical protein